MNGWLEPVAGFLQRSSYPGLLIEVLIESVLLLAVVAAGCLFCRRATAGTKHRIWFTAIVCLGLLLCLSPAPHMLLKPLWSVSTGIDSGNQVSVSLSLAPLGKSGQAALPASSPETGSASDNSLARTADRPIAARFSASWFFILFFAWAGGAVLGLVSLLAGELQLGRLARKSKVLSNPDWGFVLHEARAMLGLRRAPRIMQSAENCIPLTWGALRPVVLLPAAATGWAIERRRVVLLHELAHVKRWDCLTQTVTRIVCALFWINPLVWVAARRMRIERERACDDLVLNRGCKPSDYAAQLLDIANTFRSVRCATGIAMARRGQLQGRIEAIIDVSRPRKPHPITAIVVLGLLGILTGCLAATSGTTAREAAENSTLREQQIARLESFAAVKEKQSERLAAIAGETISPDFQRFFEAAIKGDWRMVTNRYEFFKRHHPQYANGANSIPQLRTAYWSPVLEICLAYDHVVNCEPKYTKIFADGIINSIPPGSIYFGGTDPGRGVPTAFCKSQADGDPFFTVTQNALADGTYLEYLRAMYGSKLYIPTQDDSQKCFDEYLQDAKHRLEEHQLKPGEDVRVKNGAVQVSGQVAVMSINALIAKVIFDRNPTRYFFIEESFPLDWMYPHLEPHGLILRINRQPLAGLPEEIVARDHEHWRSLVAGMLGNWLEDNTSVDKVASFVDRIDVRRNFHGFRGDPEFVGNDYAKKWASKLRSSIGGVYAWRVAHSNNAAERQRMEAEADFAFREAFAICPDSPEVVFRYSDFLVKESRPKDALVIASAAARVAPESGQFKDLVARLKESARTR